MRSDSDTDMQDVDLEAAGFPTYQEFCKNPDKYRQRYDHILASADKGSELFKNVEKQIYYVRGYKCSTLEEAHQVAVNEGFNLHTMQMIVQAEGIPGGKVRMHVTFVTPEEYERHKAKLRTEAEKEALYKKWRGF